MTVTAFLTQLASRIERPPFSDRLLATRVRTAACATLQLEEQARRIARDKKRALGIGTFPRTSPQPDTPASEPDRVPEFRPDDEPWPEPLPGPAARSKGERERAIRASRRAVPTKPVKGRS